MRNIHEGEEEKDFKEDKNENFKWKVMFEILNFDIFKSINF